MKNRRCLIALLTLAMATPVFAEPPKLFQRMFRGAAKIEADPNAEYLLSKEDGPWLILAHTFVGTDSKLKANRLAVQLRQSLGLRAFIYRESFDFTRGPEDINAEAKRLRYANPYQYEAYAVLVGEYDSVDHPNTVKDLARVKTAQPAIFNDRRAMDQEVDKLSPVTAIKAMHKKLLTARKEQPSGPMFNAFMTRNPLLPSDYFQSPTVEPFVESLNEGLPHSLLDCQGKFTVVVRTFEGYATIANGRFDKQFKANGDRLVRCAKDAARMTEKLREKGIEAYQYHDREKSIVTVGSFEQLGRELPDGNYEYSPAIRKIIDQYRAFNVDPGLAQQVPLGRNGAAANNVAMMPFDVQPLPIAIPKRSQRSLFSRAYRR